MEPLDGASLLAGHNSDGKFIARAQRIEFDCETIPRRVAIFIEKSKDGQVMPVPNVVVRDVACGANHTVSRHRRIQQVVYVLSLWNHHSDPVWRL